MRAFVLVLKTACVVLKSSAPVIQEHIVATMLEPRR